MALTPVYSLNKPTVGGNANTWGGLLNDNFDAIDDAIFGVQSQINRQWLSDVATLLADISLTYTPSQPGTVAPGDIVRTRAEGFSYEVAASGATDQHVNTAGGVKLYVQPGISGFVDIRAFGATGLSTDDQNTAAVAADASGLPVFIPAGFILKYSTPLTLSAPWRGAYKGQGNPGSATDTATASTTSELRFTGTGWAVTTSQEFSNLALRGDATVSGQNGLRIVGAVGQTAGPCRIMEFDGTGCELGNSDTSSGIYFADLSALEMNNRARIGTIGVNIPGGVGAASTNGNIIKGAFVTGAWETYFKISGHNNTFVGGDIQPEDTLVAGLGGTISEGALIEGDGNTWINPYFEPVGTSTCVLVRYAAGSNGNKLERLYTPSSGGSFFGRIVDLGCQNELTLVQIGENFSPSIGVPFSGRNLIPNPSFFIGGASVPFGWQLGGGSTGTVAVDTTVTRGGARTLKITTSATRAQLDCYVASTSSLSSRSAVSFVPIAALRKQTVTVGVWCLSSVAGLGAIKVFNNTTSLGVAEHSGSGEWEFLTVRTRIEDSAADVAIRLRNSSSFTNTTGDCWFSEPVVYVGNDAPRFDGVKYLESNDAAMFGRMSWSPAQTLTIDSATPSVAGGNLFTEASTVATTITNFLEGRNGQEIKIITTTANATLENNANIQTTTGANKVLAINRVYCLVFNGTKWFEVGP